MNLLVRASTRLLKILVARINNVVSTYAITTCSTYLCHDLFLPILDVRRHISPHCFYLRKVTLL